MFAISINRHHGGWMKKEAEPVRGVFERPAGSGCWWINYYANGKQHREKAGRRGDAVALYQKRKADARRKIKLPELMPGRVVTFGDLSAMAVEHATTHLATTHDYVAKHRILLEPFGSRPAAEITPQEIDRFLTGLRRSNATCNRYRAYFSLAYRLGMENGKVSINPARLVRPRKEDNARTRYLTREEYDKLLGIIRRDNPDQAPSFIASVFTGMRWSEQYSITWSQVDLKRKKIRLEKTKNGSKRDVPLNSVALAALYEQQARVEHGRNDLVFPRSGPGSDTRWWFEPALVEAGITQYVWHSNRHTFCSWLALTGVGLKEMQTLSGHKTITMVARYAHLSPEATESASERMVGLR